jgi:hypothetical protein
MSSVVRTVKKAVKSIGKAFDSAIEAVGDLAEDIVDVAVKAVEDVGRFVKTTVKAALDDPLGTLATIATAVYAPYLLPVVSAGRVVANGGDLEDALKAAAISYVSGQAGQYVGNQIGTAATYGTNLGSAQTAMLAAQSGDMLGGTWGGTLGNLAGAATSGATAGLLTGGDPIEMALNALGTAGVRLGTNYALDAAGRLVDSAGSLISDTSKAAEITNPAQEGDVGYGFRYFDDGTVIDPFGNYFKDNALVWSPNVTEIENLSEVGDEAYGWKFFSDGTSMSPQGEYYDDTGAKIWSPFQTEEVVSLTEGAKLIDNPAKEGEEGYGWKYYSNGVVISPDGEYFKDNELVWSPFEGGAQDFFDRTNLQEIPNTAKEGEEGYGWRYFTDGTVMDPDGRYLDQEGKLLWQPGEQDSADPSLFDSKLVKGAKDYLVRQLKNQFVSGVSGGLKNILFGSERGREAMSAAKKAGKPPTPETLTELGFGDLLLPGQDEDFSEEFQTTSSDTTEGLFNPLESMNWAPQTKIGGLGTAGKYINQDADTYFPNKDQEQKQKAREALQTRGWLTDEEQEALGDENPYFEYEPTKYSMAPWMQPESEEQPVFAAEGGLIDHNPEFYSEGGASFANRYVKGRGDGTSDSVPAMLASGEFVIPADVVSGLGNGDNDAGAKVLDQFMVAIRKHKRNADPSELPPDSAGPLSYLAEAMKKAKK